MGDTLEFNGIHQEVKGFWNDGCLRFSKQNIAYKNSKTGKLDNIPAGELSVAQWRHVCLGFGIKLSTSSGHVYKYDGFRDTDFERISDFFKANYKVELTEKDMCVNGWNWGTANLSGPMLSFDVDENTAFEIPLSNVSQCTTGKNEVTLEFHQNDDAEVSLMEVRFYVPPGQVDKGQDPVEVFANSVLSKADVIQATGDAMCIFKEIQCLTPRGRYDILVYPTFLHLHGKSFDFKIPYTTMLRLFLLPHKDQRQMFFVISFDPPIKLGQTRYQFLILLFSKEEDNSLTLNMSEEDVERRFEGKLSKNMSGPLYELVSNVMKALVNRKITLPGNFVGHSGDQCITCSYKASSGLLYPLERGFIYMYRPPVHLRFDEISFVNFARSTITTRSFDFEVVTKQGNEYTFSSIEREEYGKLFDFVNGKKLNIKNRGFKESTKGNNDNRYSDSDDDQHDVYLERMKDEGKIREEGNYVTEDESDESYLPGEEDNDAALEDDGNGLSDSYEGDDSEDDRKASVRSDPSEGDSKNMRQAKKPKVLQEKKERKPLKEKKQKDTGGPKRPMPAYMLFHNANRELIISETPGISVTEVARKAGEIWRQLGQEQKKEWEKKALEAKAQYDEAQKDYKESGGVAMPSKMEKKNAGKNMRKSAGGDKEKARREGGHENYKSQEFIEMSDTDHNESDEEESH